MKDAQKYQYNARKNYLGITVVKINDFLIKRELKIRELKIIISICLLYKHMLNSKGEMSHEKFSRGVF